MRWAGASCGTSASRCTGLLHRVAPVPVDAMSCCMVWHQCRSVRWAAASCGTSASRCTRQDRAAAGALDRFERRLMPARPYDLYYPSLAFIVHRCTKADALRIGVPSDCFFSSLWMILSASRRPSSLYCARTKSSCWAVWSTPKASSVEVHAAGENSNVAHSGTSGT